MLDASVVLELLLRTPVAEAIESRLFKNGQSFHAPHLIDAEVAQVLRRYVISGDMPPDRGRSALADFMDLSLVRYAHDFLLPRVWELRNNLTAYDALYVALAEVLDAPLLTRDQRLSHTSGHHARIEFV